LRADYQKSLLIHASKDFEKRLGLFPYSAGRFIKGPAPHTRVKINSYHLTSPFNTYLRYTIINAIQPSIRFRANEGAPILKVPTSQLHYLLRFLAKPLRQTPKGLSLIFYSTGSGRKNHEILKCTFK
jgi:hypothetical protein